MVGSVSRGDRGGSVWGIWNGLVDTTLTQVTLLDYGSGLVSWNFHGMIGEHPLSSSKHGLTAIALRPHG